ncbi:hypothetical protein ACFYO2_45105 [Streptomyces sp. NPDC006602]|uniref:hypothetical protein n=1 Tax=Streptomyces sp. NPDC006602 TaxID=3364751 RepID=UPI0036B36B7C
MKAQCVDAGDIDAVRAAIAERVERAKAKPGVGRAALRRLEQRASTSNGQA